MSTTSHTAEGTSNTGNFQEALDHALQGLNSVGDQRIFWKVTDITGKKGGFVPLKSLTVKVSYTIEGEKDSSNEDDGGQLPK